MSFQPSGMRPSLMAFFSSIEFGQSPWRARPVCNVWPAPSARVFAFLPLPVRYNVSGQRKIPSQDGDPRASVLIMLSADFRPSKPSGFQAAVRLSGHLASTTRKQRWSIAGFTLAGEVLRQPIPQFIAKTSHGSRLVRMPNVSRRRRTAHATRANLLARAATTTFLCARVSRLLAQVPSGVSLCAR